MKKIIFGLLTSALGITANAGTVVFHNNTDAVVHQDYVSSGCKSDEQPNQYGNFLPGKTVTFTCNANISIQLAQYSAPKKFGQEIKCYFDGDRIVTPNDHCTMTTKDGIPTITLEWVSKVDYAKMQSNVQTVVNKFNADRKDVMLIPNVIPMNQAQLDKTKGDPEKWWSLQFGFDSSRYPLFNGSNCLANPTMASCESAKNILKGLLAAVKKIPNVSHDYTLPSNGIWAFSVGNSKAGDAVEKSKYPKESGGTPALDGPIAVAELAMNGKSTFYQGMINTLKNYDIANRTPESAKNPAGEDEKKKFMASTGPYFNGTLALLTQALLVGNGDFERTRHLSAGLSKVTTTKHSSEYVSIENFKANYDKWATRAFLAPFEVTDKKGIKSVASRVIFTVRNAPHTAEDNWPQAGNSTTVSEGMSYGLLLAYAANDQILFNKFLNFILFEADIHGCAGRDQGVCKTKSQYLMPWMVDETGRPIHYTIGEGWLTDGSATDADINIAWALKLAAARVAAGDWEKENKKENKDTFIYNSMNYATLAANMQKEIANFDINDNMEYFGTKIGVLYSPGSQWDVAGTKVFYPGYDAPQAFEALSK